MVSDELNELLRCSFVIVDKPRGPSSHEVAAWVRKLTGAQKSGHSGTLDPKVSGVLPVGIGKATKLLPFLTTKDKKYVCLMSTKKPQTDEQYRAMFARFTGTITQTPPKESAVAKKARKRKVYYIKPIQMKPTQALFEVHCEAGTYIRVLVSDFGRLCGGAEMLELRRVAVGNIYESSAHNLQQVSDAIWAARRGEESALMRYLIPPQEALSLRKVVLHDSAVEAVCAGAPLYAPGLASCDAKIRREDFVSLLTGKGEFIGVGVARLTSEEMGAHKSGVACTPETIVMERGKYQKNW
ncbi:MAG: RNA-guided pseudouridylation complex pseudouridine synthase subunit Cbf5 [Candidatus Micrarchaeota archaeon]|nr:RNA-guided pseudouridylation complex pseudouridine synthase subunit Cbf5 [Candidatus Micrarchaeota archaeon]